MQVSEQLFDSDDGQQFTINLNPVTAWTLRNKITPGPYFRVPAFDEGVTRSVYDRLENFRMKINEAIVALIEDENLDAFPIAITAPEGWMIDQVISPDGIDGPYTDLLLQVYRGMFYARHGIGDLIPTSIVTDEERSPARPPLSKT